MSRAVRVILALSLPVTIFLVFLLFTIIVAWGRGKNLCDTWMDSVLPYCK